MYVLREILPYKGLNVKGLNIECSVCHVTGGVCHVTGGVCLLVSSSL